MNQLFDVLLPRPFSIEVIEALLFGTFVFHFLFVLLMIGTAILFMFYFVRVAWGNRPEAFLWGQGVYRTFTAHKSLAVVLGVGPLLVIQVGLTVPFFTAMNLYVPFWLMIVITLIISFLSFEVLGFDWRVHRYRGLVFGIIGLTGLLAVPGVFVAVLSTMENSSYWVEIVQNGYRLTGALALHWFVRYSHVIGAAIVFGAVFHYLFSRQEETQKKRTLIRWIIGGLLFQIVAGVLLLLSVPMGIDTTTAIPLIVGIISAIVALVWVVLTRRLALVYAPALFLFILIPMLLTRQVIQARGVLPLVQQLDQNAAAYQSTLKPYEAQALERYQGQLNTVYNNGETMYASSCSFCHGPQADGKGPEAQNLTIAPEVLSQARMTRPYLNGILRTGVPGSGMPYFTMFTRDHLDSVINYLDQRYHVLAKPTAVSAPVSRAAQSQAQATYFTTCVFCHGSDGKNSTAVSKQMTPHPPDFTAFTLMPDRAFEVITNGYPGTGMPSFGNLSEEERWGLVMQIQSFYSGGVQ